MEGATVMDRDRGEQAEQEQNAAVGPTGRSDGPVLAILHRARPQDFNVIERPCKDDV